MRNEPVVGTGDLVRPPTLFGRQSDEELARSGYDLARRAVGYALEGVPLRDAVATVAREAPSRPSLRMAIDYLAFVRFEDVPRGAQVEALCLVEDARTAFDREHGSVATDWLGSLWRRARSRFGDAMRTRGELYERHGADPFGGPLLPV